MTKLFILPRRFAPHADILKKKGTVPFFTIRRHVMMDIQDKKGDCPLFLPFFFAYYDK